MNISEDIIEKIKYENDIVDIISETVRLKRAGRNYFGLCPFHNEKTPSFSVSADKQIFKCFGCGEAGNVITFIMKTKNLSFYDACVFLGERANIQISDNKDINERDKYSKLYEVNVEAARYFFRNLTKNKRAKDYFLVRGMSEKIMKNFGLGYASDSWSSLLNYLKNKGYSELEMSSLGLIIKGKNEGFYDRFRNRVIFPVFNQYGKVIGFGGRVLDDSKPKYLNSPESSIFDKGSNLYGLNFAIKSNINRTLIVVEGYMDCISLHQHGVTNVVASLGTALTNNQAKLIKKYADNVIIAYDADAAGEAATLRGLQVLRKEGLKVKILRIPQGKDPDEFIKNHGYNEFMELVSNALPLIDYRIKKAGEGINFKSNEGLIKYVNIVTEILIDLDPVEKDVYIKRISEDTGIKEQSIYDLINKEMKKDSKNDEWMNIKVNLRQKLYLEPSYIKAERSILKLMLDKKNFDYIINRIDAKDMIMETHKKIFELILKNSELESEMLYKTVEIKCADLESMKEWINICDIDIIGTNEDDTVKFTEDCIKEIRKSKLEESKRKIMNDIKALENNGLFGETIKLAVELQKIEDNIRKI